MRRSNKWLAGALGFLVLAPVVLMSRYVHFQPSGWWLETAFPYALAAGVILPAVWIIRGFGEPDGPIVHPSGLPDNHFIFRIFPALATFGLIFVTGYITLPGVLALALGGPTTQQVIAQMNYVGSVDRPSAGCQHKSVIRDRVDDLFGRLCFDSKEEKALARSMGTVVVVDLHGWGNSFGIFYTSTDPVGPANP